MASHLIDIYTNDTSSGDLVDSSLVSSTRAIAGKPWHKSAWDIVETIPIARPPLALSVPLLFIVLPVAYYVIYQVYLHPLAKYPGPFWAKLTGMRAGYHAWIGDIHLDMYRCHQKYGSYDIRANPSLLSTPLNSSVHAPTYDSRPTICFSIRQQQSKVSLRQWTRCEDKLTEILVDIYGHGKSMQKSQPYLAMVHNTPSTFTLIDKKEHAWKKRILSQKLSESSIRQYEPAIIEIITRLCDVICPPSTNKPAEAASSATEKSWSEPNNMSARCDHLFFDLITTVVFGENFDLLRSSWYHYIPEALAKSNERISVIIMFPLIVWRRLDKKLFRNSVGGRRDFLRFVHNLVSHRMKGDPRKDIFTDLLNVADPTTGKKLSRDEIVAESILMLVAGSDTSSTGLASMFFYLSRNPDKREKLTQEVRSTFKCREEIRFGPKLNSCRYLQACVSECLRLTPPVAAAPFREVMKGGAIADGQFIPEGTNIGTGIYSIQHNEEYFQNAYEFAPERWLRDGRAESRIDTDAHIPFMIGPRACLGKTLATAQSMLAMAHVCWLMDFTVVESMKNVGAGKVGGPPGRHRPDEYQMYDHITAARDGPWVQFRRRD